MPSTSQRSGNQRDKANGRANPRRVAQLEASAQVPLKEIIEDAEAEAQADFEGVPRPLFVEFFGERYRLAGKVGYLPLLKFAYYAAIGTDSASMQGMAAMYEMLQACFDRGQPCGTCDVCTGDPGASPPVRPSPRLCLTRAGDEWPRFEAHALDVNADDEELFAVVTAVIEQTSARPTRRRSDSSPPAPRTSPRSRDGSRSPPGADGLTTVDGLAR